MTAHPQRCNKKGCEKDARWNFEGQWFVCDDHVDESEKLLRENVRPTITRSLITIHSAGEPPAPCRQPKEICDKCELDWLECGIDAEICEQEQHDQRVASKARAAERGKVLDAVLDALEKEKYYDNYRGVYRKIIESLRQQEEK